MESGARWLVRRGGRENRKQRFSIRIAGGKPEHLAVRLFGVEPEQRELRKLLFEASSATADLAQQAAFVGEMSSRLAQDAADDGKTVRAAVEGELRFAAAFRRQGRHPLGVDIGRIGDDQVVALAAERDE